MDLFSNPLLTPICSSLLSNTTIHRYAYIEYNSQAQAKEALSKFRETPVAEWFVIEAVNQGKAEIGVWCGWWA